MSLNPVDIVVGALRGAAAEALPGALAPIVNEAINAAHQTPSSAPLPADARPPVDLIVEAVTARLEERLKATPAVQQVREEAQPVVWWQSPVMLGSILGLFAPLLGLLGFSLSPTDQASLVQIVIGLIGAIGSAIALVSRLRSRAQPVTATRSENAANLLLAALAGSLLLILMMAPPAIAAGRAVVIGDSIAAGVRQACACPGRTRVGASSRTVLGYVRSSAIAGRRVVLSSGASNSPGDLASVSAQLASLANSGADVTLLGVGPRFARLNPRLAAIAAAHGARFMPLGRTADGVHPVSYGALAHRVR